MPYTLCAIGVFLQDGAGMISREERKRRDTTLLDHPIHQARKREVQRSRDGLVLQDVPIAGRIPAREKITVKMKRPRIGADGVPANVAGREVRLPAGTRAAIVDYE